MIAGTNRTFYETLNLNVLISTLVSKKVACFISFSMKFVFVARHYCLSEDRRCSQTSLKVLGFFSVNFCTSSEIMSNSPSAVAFVKDTISELFQGLPLLKELARFPTLR